MSQPCERFKFAAIDPFLGLAEQGEFVDRTESNDIGGSRRVDHPLFSPNSEDVLDELDFPFHHVSEVHLSSTDSSSTSTPEPQSYHFGSFDPHHPYLVAIPNNSHVHEHEHQHTNHLEPANTQENDHQCVYRLDHGIDSPIVSPRSLPFRSSSTSEYLHPDPTTQTYVRRRSLSHSDVNQIIDHPPNPTLVRLRQRRARSTTSDEKRRSGPYSTHGRAASGGRSKGRSLPTVGMFQTSHGGTEFDKRAPMLIGTSLKQNIEVVNASGSGYDPLLEHDYFSNPLLSMHQNDPAILRMTDLHDLERSRHIIEIGAMTAVSRPKQNHLEQPPSGTKLEYMLKTVEDVERHFQETNGGPEVLEACTMIRKTLVQDEIDKDAHGLCKKGLEVVELPSGVLSAESWGTCVGDEDEDDITAMLMMMEGDEIEGTC